MPQRPITEEIIMAAPVYFLSGYADDCSILGHYGPFASREAAMSFCERELKHHASECWSVDRLQKAWPLRGRRATWHQLQALGWSSSERCLGVKDYSSNIKARCLG
jgi:hypothetical protein